MNKQYEPMQEAEPDRAPQLALFESLFDTLKYLLRSLPVDQRMTMLFRFQMRSMQVITNRTQNEDQILNNIFAEINSRLETLEQQQQRQ